MNHFSGVRGSNLEKLVASLSRTKPTWKVNLLNVQPLTGENPCRQWSSDETDAEDATYYGFKIVVDRLLLHGTSTHCATSGSPPLSKLHPDGSPFEIMNLDVWTLTPSYYLEDVEKLNWGNLFVRPIIISTAAAIVKLYHVRVHACMVHAFIHTPSVP